MKSDNPHVSNDAAYMYEVLSKKGLLLTFICRSLSNRLFKTWSTLRGNMTIDIRYVKNVRNVSQTYFRTFGRISTNKSANTVMLESCSRRKGISVADSIELDFRNVKHYSVFNGQIVAVEAINPVGDVLYVRDIFTKAYALPACTPSRIESNINIFVAAGPFTVSSNMHYQPLWDLMNKVASDQPHVLVLVGPFLEHTHPEIQDGLVKDTHQELFEKILARIMESVK